MAKKEIKVLESSEHSFLIYNINDKEMYASEIARKVGEQQGTTQRRLMKLKTAGFIGIKEHPEKRKNIKLFYVKWDKVLDEFIRLLKEQKKEFIDTHNNIKTNIKPDKLELLEQLENKDYINNLKNNIYLLNALKVYFSSIAKLKRCSLSYTLGYFTFFGDFEFTTLTCPSIRQVISQIDLKKDLEALENKKNNYPFFPPKAEVNTKKWYDEFKKFHDEERNRNRSRFDKENKELENIIKKDKDLEIILKFNEIRRLLGMDLGLQISLNDAIEQTAFKVISNNFKKDEIENYCSNIFFPYSLIYKDTPENIKKEIKEKIEKMYKNDTNAPKPKTSKHKESIKK